jgi:hypothetical protein
MGVYKFSSAGSLKNARANYKSMLADNESFRITDYDLIATAITSTATQLVISNIPQNYKHLQLRIITRADSAVTTSVLGFQINSDAGANYGYGSHAIKGNGTSVTSYNGGGTGYPTVRCFDIPGASSSSDVWGSGIIDILDYSSTTKNKTVKSFGGVALSGINSISLVSGVWFSTAAITRLQINTSSTPFLISPGTEARLYGIRG